MFIDLVLAGKFDEALAFLSDDKNVIDVAYVDEGRNNTAQIVWLKMVESLQQFYAPFRFKRSVYCSELEPSHKQAKALIELVFEIFLALKQRGYSFSHKNAEGKNGLDLLRSIKISYFEFNFLEKMELFLVCELEAEMQILVPGRKYVDDLSLFRGAKNPTKKCEIPDRLPGVPTQLSLHQVMRSYAFHLEDHGFGLRAKNLALATIAFIVSSKPHVKGGDHERRLVMLRVFLNNMAVKVEAGLHSEMALVANLKRDVQAPASTIVEELFAQCAGQNGVKVYGAIVDVGSRREVCDGCGNALSDIQKQAGEGSFIDRLVAQLRGRGFVVSEKRKPPISLVVRASGLDDPSFRGDPDQTVMRPMFHPAVNRDIRRHQPGVLFHLPPAVRDPEEDDKPTGTKRYYSDILGTRESREMDVAYKKRKLNDGAVAQSEQHSFAAGLFTAFANGGGKATDEKATDALAQPIKLSAEQMQVVMRI